MQWCAYNHLVHLEELSNHGHMMLICVCHAYGILWSMEAWNCKWTSVQVLIGLIVKDCGVVKEFYNTHKDLLCGCLRFCVFDIH